MIHCLQIALARAIKSSFTSPKTVAKTLRVVHLSWKKVNWLLITWSKQICWMNSFSQFHPKISHKTETAMPPKSARLTGLRTPQPRKCLHWLSEHALQYERNTYLSKWHYQIATRPKTRQSTRTGPHKTTPVTKALPWNCTNPAGHFLQVSGWGFPATRLAQSRCFACVQERKKVKPIKLYPLLVYCAKF